MRADKAGHLVGGVRISYTFILNFSSFTCIHHIARTTETIAPYFKRVVKFEDLYSVQLF